MIFSSALRWISSAPQKYCLRYVAGRIWYRAYGWHTSRLTCSKMCSHSQLVSQLHRNQTEILPSCRIQLGFSLCICITWDVY
ncbi:hypothetical protein PsYK624_067160 [Phanerochaete sordida]|uniref:Uncharacterized protein n=1 Tax=Phanerochaete sordida TaxID=48140 RepID=A0A9P3G788_9APHY|nr:hypothetical protein PsYK624_067160 [Phanerochaete sordida]